MLARLRAALVDERLRAVVERPRADVVVDLRARAVVERPRAGVVDLRLRAVVERPRAAVERPRAELVDLRLRAVVERPLEEPLRADVERPRAEVLLLRDVLARPRLDAFARVEPLDERLRAVVARPRAEPDARPRAVVPERLRLDVVLFPRAREVEALPREAVLLELPELTLRLLAVRVATFFARPADAPRLFALLFVFAGGT